MNLTEYQNSAQRTLPDLGSIYSGYLSIAQAEQLSLKLNLSHMVLGMGSEMSEVHDARVNLDDINLSEELADIMWYVANYCNLRGFDLEGLLIDFDQIKETHNNHFGYQISELIDHVKKFVAYNKPLDIDTELSHLYYIVSSIKSQFSEMSVTFEQALNNNIGKLKARYPDKFDENLALNRNLDAERRELEK